jgi:hypothetical protein
MSRSDLFERFRELAERADSLQPDGDASGIARALLAILDETEPIASDPDIRDMRAKIYGRVSRCHMTIGDDEKARAYTTLALRESEKNADMEGVRVYRRNLIWLDALAGTPEDDARLEAVARAQDLSDRGEWEDSNEILLKLLSGSPVVTAKILGLAGYNFFQLGAISEARDFTHRALRAATEAGDTEGVFVYQENLRTMDRAATREG